MCEHCIDRFFRDNEGGRELCIFDPDKPLEINYSDPACEHFELSETAAAERQMSVASGNNKGDRECSAIDIPHCESRRINEIIPKTTIHVKFSGEDGNLFHLLALTINALRIGGYEDLIPYVKESVSDSSSFEDALRRIMEYVIID